MPLTINHVHTATTPDITNQSYDILPQRDWNDTHLFTLSAAGSEILPAFSNPGGPGAVFFGSNTAGFVTATAAAVLLSAGTQLAHAGTVSFGNSNNVSFGMDSNNVLTATVAPGTGGILAVAAGSQSVSTGSISFANSGNVSFGMSGSNSITASYSQTVQTQGQQAVTISGNIVGAGALISSGTMVLAGGPNVTLSQNGQTISISAGAGGPGGGVALSGPGGSVSSGTVSFANANGVSFGFNGSTVTASIAAVGGAQTGISTVNAGGVTVTQGAISFANGNGVTFTGNGSTISASVAQQTVQTQASGAIAGSGFTFNGANVSGSGTHNSAGLALSLSAAAPGGGGVAVTAPGASLSSGTLQFSNLNGVTFGMVGSTLTASVAAVGGAQTGISSIAVAGSTVTAGAVQFSNANNVSFGLNGSTMTASIPAQSVPNLSLFALGNTTQNSSTVLNANALSFNGAGEATVGFSGGSIQLSVPAQSIGVSGGNTSNTSGTFSGQVVFQGGNNITLSVNTAAGGAQTILVSGANVGGAQTGISSVIVSNTTYTSGAISFSNANGISFGSSAGQAITASYTQSAQAFSASGGSSTFSTLNFANSNGITFTNTGGSIAASFSAPPAQTTQTLGIYASSQTTGASSSSTFNATNLTLVGAGGVSIGATNGSIVISGASPGAAASASMYALSQTTGGASSSVIPLSAFSVNAYGAISAGFSGGSLQLSAPGTVALTQLSVGMSTNGNTAGTTGLATGQLVLVGTNGITLSGSTNGNSMTISLSGGGGGGGAATNTYYVTGNSTNSSSGTIANSSILFAASGGISAGVSNGSIQLSAPQSSLLTGVGGISLSTNGSTISVSGVLSSLIGVGGITLSSAGASISISEIPLSRMVWPPAPQLTAVSAPGNATASLQYVPLMQGVSMSRVDLLMGVTAGSSATTNTCAIAISAYGAFYTLNGSTLSSVASGSTQTTYSFASNTAGQTQLSAGAIRPISIPLAANLTPGEYWFGGNMVTATSSIGASTTNAGFTFSVMGGNDLQTALNYAEFTANTNGSTNLLRMGLYSVATTGLPPSISLSAINQTGAAVSQANIAFVMRNV